MDEDDLQHRLKQLERKLGKLVRLEERQIHDEEKNKTGDLVPDRVHSHHGWAEKSGVSSQPWGEAPPESDPESQIPDDGEAKARELRRAVAFENLSFEFGQALDPQATFCPLKVMQSYPYRFIGKANKPRAIPFFHGILEGRDWDIFYLHDPRNPSRDPVLLVPSAQFEVFLDEINEELKTALAIPAGVNKDRFYLTFVEGTPRPRYLRRTHHKSDLDIKTWPAITDKDIEDYEKATGGSKSAWCTKFKITKTGSAPTGDSEKAARKKKERQLMLTKARSLLGIDGQGYPGNAVLVCVDVEAIEVAPNPVSEVGIAILDMQSVRDIAPGYRGDNWWPFIECHHLRVLEYSGLKNYRFVKGCPNNFDFGTSSFPPKDQLAEAVMSVLKPFMNESHEIILVGHDVSQDIRYLSSFGVDIPGLENLTGQLDSQDLHLVWRNETSGRGLSTVLSELGIASKNLHNAGNDAFYTLCATIGVTLRQDADAKAAAKDEAAPSGEA